MSRVETEIMQDLKNYLGDEYDEEQVTTLLFCVKRAIKSFQNKRNYPETYSETVIQNDMDRFYMCIFDLALYWCSKQGVEFHGNFSGNGESRSWDSEEKIYSLHNVISIARIV